MDKQALRTDMGTVGRFAAGGLLAGGGTAALLNLIHMLREQRKEQKEIEDEGITDKDTIVINLPPKGAAVMAKFASMCKNVESTAKAETVIDNGANAGGRRKGKYANPRKIKVTDSEGAEIKTATGWPTLTMSALAGIGGAGVGVALVDKLYQMRRERMLKDELAAAQQEYMGALTGKKASAIDELFPIALDKQADTNHTFGMLNYPMAAAALLTLMGAGGTAYITKRILDEKLREANERNLDIPKVKRIVFKTAPGSGARPGDIPEDMKEASAQDMESIKAALFVVMDKLDTCSKVLNTPEVKKAQAASGLSTHKLFSLSDENIGVIMDALNKNPELARIIVQKGMSMRPIMKHFQWMAGTTPGLAMGKHSIRSMLENFREPTAKVAGITDMAAAMMLGKTLGEGTGDAAKALLDAGGIAQTPEEEQADNGKAKTDLSKVTVSSDDPESDDYLRANKAKVVKILKRLADEGKL